VFPYLPEGIFVSHAHIGHYTGLMELGYEVMNTKNIPVYTLSEMAEFLKSNGPWDQLVSYKNIILNPGAPGDVIELSKKIKVITMQIPHRDEYTETAGYKIELGERKYLFIPDIDKWEKWEKDIIQEVSNVDIAFLDGTFFSADELQGRDMDQIPHPFIIETMEYFRDEDSSIRNKVFFIHFNHTNPALYQGEIKSMINEKGFGITEQGVRY
jgi:pyrroloquinoline quinone biosynthesis protein B